MTTLMPAVWHSLTASGTAGRNGSAIPTRPRYSNGKPRGVCGRALSTVRRPWPGRAPACLRATFHRLPSAPARDLRRKDGRVPRWPRPRPLPPRSTHRSRPAPIPLQPQAERKDAQAQAYDGKVADQTAGLDPQAWWLGFDLRDGDSDLADFAARTSRRYFGPPMAPDDKIARVHVGQVAAARPPRQRYRLSNNFSHGRSLTGEQRLVGVEIVAT